MDKLTFTCKILLDQRIVELRNENEQLRSENDYLNFKYFDTEYSIENLKTLMKNTSMCCCPLCIPDHDDYVFPPITTPNPCTLYSRMKKIFKQCGIKVTSSLSSHNRAASSHLICIGQYPLDYNKISDFGGLLKDHNPDAKNEKQKIIRMFKILQEVKADMDRIDTFEREYDLCPMETINDLISKANRKISQCTCIKCQCACRTNTSTAFTFMPCHFDIWLQAIAKECRIRISEDKSDNSGHIFYKCNRGLDGYLQIRKGFSVKVASRVARMTVTYSNLIGYEMKNRPSDLDAVRRFIEALRHAVGNPN